MKFFTKNKVIAGVIGLMALVSVVNTQAILSLTNYVKGEKVGGMVLNGENQEAQVFGSTTNCIRLYPASSNHTSFIDPSSFSENFDGLSSHMFVVGFKIKNTCNRSISIIKDGFTFPNGGNSFQTSKLEDFPNINNQTSSSGYSFSGPNASFITDINGLLSPDLIVLNSNLDGVTPTGDGEMKAFNIPASSEKEFIVFSYANASNQNIEHHTRLSLKKIRWFFTQSYQDNSLSNSEVKVYSLNTSDLEKYRTSYARFKGVSEDCAKGTIIGHDANGNPIFCGDTVGDGDCAEGTIIGYAADGTPIFCGDDNSGGNDCAEGTIIGYDANGNPILCGDQNTGGTGD
ncbi:MAG: hypothetical protein QG654_249, partial [Patescibacteria group bacterium]|nr:hypothetical protein [Patescibacteria group bacterium]